MRRTRGTEQLSGVQTLDPIAMIAPLIAVQLKKLPMDTVVIWDMGGDYSFIKYGYC
jgi:hypothetical protein